MTEFSPVRAARWVLILGAVGSLFTMFLRGPRDAGSFGMGAALSAVSLYSWVRITDLVGESGKRPPRASAMFFAFRFVLIGIGLYVIVKYLGISPIPMIVGLLASFAAVVLELLYTLWKSTS